MFTLLFHALFARRVYVYSTEVKSKDLYLEHVIPARNAMIFRCSTTVRRDLLPPILPAPCNIRSIVVAFRLAVVPLVDFLCVRRVVGVRVVSPFYFLFRLA